MTRWFTYCDGEGMSHVTEILDPKNPHEEYPCAICGKGILVADLCKECAVDNDPFLISDEESQWQILKYEYYEE